MAHNGRQPSGVAFYLRWLRRRFARARRPAQYKLTTLATFNGTNGANPIAGLIADASGNLYGTTLNGGANNDGTVFEVANDADHTLSTLATFNGPNGANPIAGLLADASGNLYGTTFQGGADIYGGTVFEVANDANHTLTTLVTFNSQGVFGPNGLIADANGNLYGTTQYGPGPNGTSYSDAVFEVANDGHHTLSVLATLNGSLNPEPMGTLIMDPSGNLYGTTRNGGHGIGSVFELPAGTHSIKTLVSFGATNGVPNGYSPFAGLIADASGNLYGTTFVTVFEVANDANHTLTTLATLYGPSGYGPDGSLIADASGNLYGTTTSGGDLTLNGNGDGTVFEVANDANHTLTTLTTFNGTNGADPAGGLLADTSGNFYGTTREGGAYGDGTVFELSPVPEPATLLLAGLAGVALLGLFVGRKNGMNCRSLVRRFGSQASLRRRMLLTVASMTVCACSTAGGAIQTHHPGHVQWYERRHSLRRPNRRRQRQPIRHDF